MSLLQMVGYVKHFSYIIIELGPCAYRHFFLFLDNIFLFQQEFSPSFIIEHFA